MILALAVAAALGVTGLDGQPIDPFERTGARTLVFAFIHPECPVSNRYVPELNRLYDEYKARGVRMWVVYSGGERIDELRDHRSRYRLRVPALVDPRFAIADRAGATMTAEAAVYRGEASHQAEWRLVYRGRIDDRAPRLGIWRAAPAIRDLADVLQRIDRGEELPFRATQAVGCYLKPLS
jgi:hypothetical protein